ncbi:MAG: peptidoglycan-binding domain-containing protein, partial [Candidatus Pacebacteria bacterium]|nr:peptidoglycan-binding domain-containing protein [Candidatus Paceibacterota bacterium]
MKNQNNQKEIESNETRQPRPASNGVKKILLSFIALAVLLPTMSFASIDANLGFGARGTAVTELQQFLINKGFLSVEATGNFFGLTKTAVIAYQGSKGLPTTGFVGPLTRTAIASDLETTIVPTVATACASGVAYSYLTGEPCIASVPAVVDICKNIDGVQSAVPSGMSVDGNANCSLPITLPSVSLEVVATTTVPVPSSPQFVASGNGAVDGSRATFNIISDGGTGTITELTFAFLGTPNVVS